jgi:putative transposase
MPDLLALLTCLIVEIDNTTYRQFGHIISAMLAMSGRITMKGISRWAGKGGSYRTVQRFFYHPHNWPTMMWLFFHTHCFSSQETYAIAGDEVVTTKSGKKTYGVDWFFSSLANRPVKGLAFFALSLVGLNERQSFPLRIEQILKSEEDNKTRPKAKSKPKKKGKRGRPKGSKNKDKTQYVLSSELFRLKGMLSALLNTINGLIPLQYLLLDGKFGHNNAAQMSLALGLHLVSKLRHDSALYLPYQGNNCRRKYGEKLNPRKLDSQYLTQSRLEEDWRLDYYQMQVLHKEFAAPLNVVIIVKTNLKTKEQGHVILFSTDLNLTAEKLVELYSLRFQIEFNFRDAKQYWGLEDFMNVSSKAVTNAVNLAFFMVNFSHQLLQKCRCRYHHDLSILDLKAFYRGFKYVDEMMKILPEKPEAIFISRLLNQVANLGAIHPINISSMKTK